jgi:hypothetical protein
VGFGLKTAQAIFGASYADFGFSVDDLAGEIGSVAAWVNGTAVPDAAGIERIHSILAGEEQGPILVEFLLFLLGSSARSHHRPLVRGFAAV